MKAFTPEVALPYPALSDLPRHSSLPSVFSLFAHVQGTLLMLHCKFMKTHVIIFCILLFPPLKKVMEYFGIAHYT